MKKLFVLSFVLLFALACSDDDLIDQINNIKTQLEQQQIILNSIKDGAMITELNPTENGYQLKLSDGSIINLEHGITPLISIEEDGYWYINGECSNVKASGEDGKQPSIEINESGNWVIDNKDTGVQANGKDGQNGQDGTNAPLISHITYSGQQFVFYLTDGSVITTDVLINSAPCFVSYNKNSFDIYLQDKLDSRLYY